MSTEPKRWRILRCPDHGIQLGPKDTLECGKDAGDFPCEQLLELVDVCPVSELEEVDADLRSLRRELATLLGPIAPKAGVTENDCWIAKVAMVLRRAEQAERARDAAIQRGVESEHAATRVEDELKSEKATAYVLGHKLQQAEQQAASLRGEVERLRGLIGEHRDQLDREAIGPRCSDRDDVDNRLYNAALSQPPIALGEPEDCERCKGSGVELRQGPGEWLSEECPDCGGTGLKPAPQQPQEQPERCGVGAGASAGGHPSEHSPASVDPAPESGVLSDEERVVVDFLDSWRFCPVSRASAPARSCLEDAARQLLSALPAQPAAPLFSDKDREWLKQIAVWLDAQKSLRTDLDATFLRDLASRQPQDKGLIEDAIHQLGLEAAGHTAEAERLRGQANREAAAGWQEGAAWGKRNAADRLRSIQQRGGGPR